MGNVPIRAIEKVPRAIGSLTSRVNLLEKKVAVTQTATSSASTGSVVTFSPTAPTVPAPNTGDLWYNTSNGNEVSQWNGGAWVPYQFGTGGIANNAITNALLANNSVANANLQTYALDAGQAMSQFSGQNMITDAQFANSAITAARLVDPNTLGTWAPSNAPVGNPFIVGHNFTNAGTSVSVPVGTAVPAGCALMAMVLYVTSTTFTASDSAGNSYSAGSFQTIPSQKSTILEVKNCAALTTSNTITVTASGSTKYAVVVYAVPLGYGFDLNHGYTGSGGTSVNFTTPNQNYTGEINFAIVCNINNLTYASGGGTPTGWSYLGGAAQSNYCIEACWQNAPSTLGQPFVTSYPSTPANGYLATAVGVENSGNAGHVVVTATNPASELPLMPSAGVNPAMYVNPGEQYFLSLKANVPGAVVCQMGIQMVLNTGAVLTVSQTATGYMQVSGTVTIPAGASSGYVQLIAKSATGTVAGCSILSPTCMISSVSGANWGLGNAGLTVTGLGSIATASLSVQSGSVPVLALPTNVGSEANNAAMYTLALSPGASGEAVELLISGAASSFDSNVAQITLISSAADGSSTASGQLLFNLVGQLYWDGTGTHMVNTLWGSGGNLRIGDAVVIGTSGSPENLTVHGTITLAGQIINASAGTMPWPRPSNPASAPSSYTAAWGTSITTIVTNIISDLVSAGVFS